MPKIVLGIDNSIDFTIEQRCNSELIRIIQSPEYKKLCVGAWYDHFKERSEMLGVLGDEYLECDRLKVADVDANRPFTIRWCDDYAETIEYQDETKWNIL
jgi:hypothetical protein